MTHHFRHEVKGNNMAERVILLTAAITPIQSFTGSLRSSQLRLGQYRAALRFWASVADGLNARIVVIETTGADVSELTGSVPLAQRGRTLGLPFAPSVTAIQNGIGAIEAEALDEAMSVLAADGALNTLVAKVTGRLQVRNAVNVLVAHDNLTFLGRRSLDRQFVDSRFFQVPVTLWKDYMSGLAREISDPDGRYLEHAIAYRLIRGEYERKLRVLPFPRRPIVQGVSATTGRRYGGKVSRGLNMPLSWAERRIAYVGSKQV